MTPRSGMGPVLCLVTDRRRLAGDWEPALTERIGVAARAGVHLVYVRERDLEARACMRLVEQAVRAVEGTRARVVVSDRYDVARAAGAHGVHLPADGVPGARVRRAAPPGFLVGRSVHDEHEARQAGADGVDYVVFGTVFESASKPGRGPRGAAALRAAVRSTTVPVLAIGGITPVRVPEVARSGAAGIAAIGLFLDCTLDALPDVVRQTIIAFDTSPAVP